MDQDKPPPTGKNSGEMGLCPRLRLLRDQSGNLLPQFPSTKQGDQHDPFCASRRHLLYRAGWQTIAHGPNPATAWWWCFLFSHPLCSAWQGQPKGTNTLSDASVVWISQLSLLLELIIYLFLLLFCD